MNYIFNNIVLKTFRRKLRRNMTEAEIVLWSKIRNRNLGVRFRRQYSVGSYILDFYCPEIRLAIEVDGGHHNQREQKEYDKIRTKSISDYGIVVIRFWNDEIMDNIEGVCNEIIFKIKDQT